MTIAKAIARAWTDDAYKAKLLSDPHAALKEVGITISDEIALKVVEEKDDTRFLVLPKSPPQAGDLSLTDLEQQAGVGHQTFAYPCTHSTIHCGCSTKPPCH